MCSSSTSGCLRAWQFPLHNLVSDSANPHYVSDQQETQQRLEAWPEGRGIVCIPAPPPLPCQWPAHPNEQSWPPLSMPPLSGTKNLGPPNGCLLKNPMFWLTCWLQSDARWTQKIILVLPPPPPCASTALSKHGVGVEPLF